MKFPENIEKACEKCRKVPPLGFGVVFYELKGEPLVCSACVYDALIGTLPFSGPPEWRWKDEILKKDT